MKLIKKLVDSYRTECEGAASALGWGTDEQAREHEKRAEHYYACIEYLIGEEEAKKEVFG